MFMNNNQTTDPLIVGIEHEIAARGWTKTELCEQLEISTQTYNNWRARGIPKSKRPEVAELFGWDTADFIRGKITKSNHIAEPAGPGYETATGFDKDTIDIVNKVITGKLKTVYDNMTTREQIDTVLHLYVLFSDKALAASAEDMLESTLIRLLSK